MISKTGSKIYRLLLVNLSTSKRANACLQLIWICHVCIEKRMDSTITIGIAYNCFGFVHTCTDNQKITA